MSTDKTNTDNADQPVEAAGEGKRKAHKLTTWDVVLWHVAKKKPALHYITELPIAGEKVALNEDQHALPSDLTWVPYLPTDGLFVAWVKGQGLDADLANSLVPRWHHVRTRSMAEALAQDLLNQQAEQHAKDLARVRSDLVEADRQIDALSKALEEANSITRPLAAQLEIHQRQLESMQQAMLVYKSQMWSGALAMTATYPAEAEDIMASELRDLVPRLEDEFVIFTKYLDQAKHEGNNTAAIKSRRAEGWHVQQVVLAHTDGEKAHYMAHLVRPVGWVEQSQHPLRPTLTNGAAAEMVLS